MHNIAKFLTIVVLCTLNFSPIFGQTRKSKTALQKENALLRKEVEDLKIQLDELQVSRQQENINTTVIPEYEDEGISALLPEISYEDTDSLLSLWYIHKQVDNSIEGEGYDMDSVRFSSDVSDSILIERLKKMNSFITLPFNDKVKNYMVLYSEKMPTKMAHILGLSTYYLPIFEEIFDRYGLPVELTLMSIIESALNPVATSRAGAKGIWQFMYNTAKLYKLTVNSYVDERLDVEKAADAAARYLLESYRIFGDWSLAISSYNCGSGNVNKAIRRAGGKKDFWSIYPYLPKETRGYVPAFVGALYALTYYKEYGLVPEKVNMPAHTDTFEIHRNLHFQQISDMTGITMEELRNINPQYTHDIIPGNEGSYILKLPYNYTNAFIDCQDTLYLHKAAELLNPTIVENIKNSNSSDRITYRVKSGDYLGKIAQRYGVTVKQLQNWNNLRGTNLSIGQTLYIYGASPKSGSSSKIQKQSEAKQSTPVPSNASYTNYTVKQGDTLYSIAKQYSGISAENLMQFNGISDKLQVGMVIKIPEL